ncbi:MAG: T9SS type A sorting domain-containing protein [Bacteroidales bacterium]|nr:T9SS type A sorting domain-containing protein [Bacteroidales bacterium]
MRQTVNRGIIYLISVILSILSCYSQTYVIDTLTIDTNNLNPMQSYGDDFLIKNQCAPETRALQPGWNWLSFPRLERTGNNSVNAQIFLENSLKPEPLPNIFQIRNLPKGDFDEVWLEYDYGNWDINDLTNISSDLGYKLEIDEQYFNDNYFSISGTILSSSHAIDLYGGSGQENWIGYFLTEPRWSEDAFAGVWDKLTMIKTQYWTMAKIFGHWFVDSKVGPLQYGDMVVVKCTEDCSFQWNVSAPPHAPKGYVATEYFTYEEQADYTPIYVELDTTDLPLEVGIFCDTVCYGAEVVNTGDTMVQINAYIDTTGLGGELEFAYHYALKRAHLAKSEYYIYNTITGRMEPGKIRKGDNKEWYWVSFKKEDSEAITTAPTVELLSVQPNPFNESVMIKLSVNKKTVITVRITNMQGKEIKTLMQGYQLSGHYQLTWDGSNQAGITSDPGIYLLIIETPGQVVTNKLIRMN